jgi:hypothetical protein
MISLAQAKARVALKGEGLKPIRHLDQCSQHIVLGFSLLALTSGLTDILHQVNTRVRLNNRVKFNNQKHFSHVQVSQIGVAINQP